MVKMTKVFYGDNLCKSCKKNQVENEWSTCDECIDKYAEDDGLPKG